MSVAFKKEEDRAVLLEKEKFDVQEKYEKTMEELKDTYNFLISVNGEFAEVEKKAQELKNAKELHTHIYKITKKVEG